MKPLRLFRPGPTFRRRYWLVERDTGVPTRRVRLSRQELLYLHNVGSLPSRGIAGVHPAAALSSSPRRVPAAQVTKED